MFVLVVRIALPDVAAIEQCSYAFPGVRTFSATVCAWVTPAAQVGFGGRLLAQLLERAAAVGVTQAFLEVRAQQPGRDPALSTYRFRTKAHLRHHFASASGQRAKLERLCRYVSRPPLAVERLALIAFG